jgi:hypothetical protein
MGLIAEFLASRARDLCRDTTGVPVEFTAVKVGPGARGREMISLDISEYGDPLHTRMVRAPFSLYRKPWVSTGILHEGIGERVPAMVLVPIDGLSELEAVVAMRSLPRAAELASRTTGHIPDGAAGTGRLIDSYQHSDLARFHRYFYSQDHDPSWTWHRTYDATRWDDLPICVAQILLAPNDTLLKPAAIQLVVRTMIAKGWHPRHIAGLIRSRFERDYGWGDMWYTYDAAMRADFYTRIFAGMLSTGRDSAEDFNCAATRHKDLCTNPAGVCALDTMRDTLLREVHRV